MADANPNTQEQAQPTVEATVEPEQALMSLLQAELSPSEEKADKPEGEAKSETEEEAVKEEGEEPDADAGEAEEEEEQAESENKGPERYTVKVDGQEIKVPLEELKAGYMKEADYRKKTAEVAEERKSVEKFKSEYEGKLQAATEILTVAAQTTLAELKAAEKAVEEADVDSDPAEFLKRQQVFQKKQREFNQHVTNLRTATAAQQAEQQERLQAHAQGELKKLTAALPQYGKVEERTKLANFLMTKYGFSENQIKVAVDHQFALMAHDAMQFQEMQQKGSQKVAAKPAKVMGAKPTSRANADRDLARTAAYDKVMKSGKGDDLETFFKTIM